MAVRTRGRLAPGDRLTVRELIRGTTLVMGALMARSLSAMRLRSERISSAESSESSLAASCTSGLAPARGQAAHLYQCCRNTSGVLGGVLNVIAGRICRLWCACVLPSCVICRRWRRCTPGAVCSVNNVIAYYLSQEFGPALREIICRISIPDGFSLGSTRWMVISKTKDCSGLLVVSGRPDAYGQDTGMSRTIRRRTFVPVVPERQHLSWRSDSSSLS